MIDGELVERALPSFEHGEAQAELIAQLRSAFGGPPRDGGGGWWLPTEVDVVYGADLFRHDLVGWRRERHDARPSGRPVTVRPDWVCEVLSASNASTDTVKKLRVLHSHGVPHYWLADPERRTLTVLRWESGGYLTAVTAEAGEVVRAEPFDAIELRTGPIFGDD